MYYIAINKNGPPSGCPGSQVSTGAVDDIRRATDLAFRAVAEYGLSAAIGPVSLAAMAPGDDGALMLRDTGASLVSGPVVSLPQDTTSMWQPCAVVIEYQNLSAAVGRALLAAMAPVALFMTF